LCALVPFAESVKLARGGKFGAALRAAIPKLYAHAAAKRAGSGDEQAFAGSTALWAGRKLSAWSDPTMTRSQWNRVLDAFNFDRNEIFITKVVGIEPPRHMFIDRAFCGIAWKSATWATHARDFATLGLDSCPCLYRL
jgi:hypothetical protein